MYGVVEYWSKTESYRMVKHKFLLNAHINYDFLHQPPAAIIATCLTSVCVCVGGVFNIEVGLVPLYNFKVVGEFR